MTGRRSPRIVSVLRLSHLNILLLTRFSPDYPVFLGYNGAVARDDADVVLTINIDPLLVFGEYQQGKTACFMSDCSPHWERRGYVMAILCTDYNGQHASIHRLKIKQWVTKVTPLL